MNQIVVNKVWFMTTLLLDIDSFICIFLTKLFIYIHISHPLINTLASFDPLDKIYLWGTFYKFNILVLDFIHNLIKTLQFPNYLFSSEIFSL